jgi:hypothetical protein
MGSRTLLKNVVFSPSGVGNQHVFTRQVISAPQVAVIAPGPAFLTITVINSRGHSFSISYMHAADSHRPQAV